MKIQRYWRQALEQDEEQNAQYTPVPLVVFCLGVALVIIVISIIWAAMLVSIPVWRGKLPCLVGDLRPKALLAYGYGVGVLNPPGNPTICTRVNIHLTVGGVVQALSSVI